jgi:hypothetical protein
MFFRKRKKEEDEPRPITQIVPKVVSDPVTERQSPIKVRPAYRPQLPRRVETIDSSPCTGPNLYVTTVSPMTSCNITTAAWEDRK